MRAKHSCAMRTSNSTVWESFICLFLNISRSKSVQQPVVVGNGWLVLEKKRLNEVFLDRKYTGFVVEQYRS